MLENRKDSIGMIVEGLHRGRIEEATQGLHVVAYSHAGARYAEIVCNTAQYNKLKKLPKFKELDHTVLDKGDKGQRFLNHIKDVVDEYELDGFNPDSVGGTFKTGSQITGFFFGADYKGSLPKTYATNHMNEGVELASIDLKALDKKIDDWYSKLYDGGDAKVVGQSKYYKMLDLGDKILSSERDFVKGLVRVRGDIFSSDREVCALGLALTDMGYTCESVEMTADELFESLREDDKVGFEERELVEDTIFDEIRSVDEEMIDEAKMVSFGGQMNPRFGWALIMAGGAGSGKGYILKNRVTLDAKTIDVDELKKGYVKLAKKGKIAGDDGNYNFKNSADVSALHQKVEDKGWKDKVERGFFASADPKRLPNIIYDITGSKASKLLGLGKMLKEMGYKVSLVWVVTNRQVAMIQNLSRARVVSQEMFHDIHNKVNGTVFPFLQSAEAKYYDEAWVILNSPDNAKAMTPEQRKELDDYSAIKLEKNGSAFTIPEDVAKKVYDTLGPREENPENPTTYKNFNDILPNVGDEIAKVKAGEADFLQR